MDLRLLGFGMFAFLLVASPLGIAGLLSYFAIRMMRRRQLSGEFRRRLAFLVLLGSYLVFLGYLILGEHGMGEIVFIPGLLVMTPIVLIWGGLEIVWIFQPRGRK